MNNPLVLALMCFVGVLMGGALGGFSVYLFDLLRTGRVRLPPIIALGPVRLDISGLMPPTGGAIRPADTSGIAPLLEGGSSLTGGCLAVISAGLIPLHF